MKHFYIAVSVEQDRNETTFTDRKSPEYNPGNYAYIVICTANDNLKAVLERIGGLTHANIYPTKKQAEDIVNHWNACYQANGSYLFDEVF